MRRTCMKKIATLLVTTAFALCLLSGIVQHNYLSVRASEAEQTTDNDSIPTKDELEKAEIAAENAKQDAAKAETDYAKAQAELSKLSEKDDNYWEKKEQADEQYARKEDLKRHAEDLVKSYADKLARKSGAAKPDAPTNVHKPQGAKTEDTANKVQDTTKLESEQAKPSRTDQTAQAKAGKQAELAKKQDVANQKELAKNQINKLQMQKELNLAAVKLLDAPSSFKQGSNSSISARFQAEPKDLQTVMVDGQVLDSTHYTVKAGSTIIELKASYLNTLSLGQHTLTATFLQAGKTSQGTATFLVQAIKRQVAKTGEAAQTGIALVCFLLAGAAMLSKHH